LLTQRFAGLKLWLSILALTASGVCQAQLTTSTQAQSAAIRVTSPQQNARQTANFVVVRYELQDPTSAPAGSPNFKVQLDGNDPITAASTEQNFTGLTPGQHVITIQLVDANGTPIPNSRTQVQFVVLPTAQNGGQPGGQGTGAGSTQTPGPSQASHKAADGQVADVQLASSLPQTGSLMPVVSIVGFGLLVGGIVSAFKTKA
jgi:LPXTG-motif cell wall-anchored protein